MPRFRFLWKMIFDGRGAPLPPEHTPDPSTWRDDGITGSCLGHATVLMNFLGAVVLTDPVFSRRVGPGLRPFILGPKRYLAPALAPKDVPSPGMIVLSHAHFDHLDTPSLRRFARDTPIVTAADTGDLLRGLGFRVIHELDWGDSVDVTPKGSAGTLRIRAVEVNHWGARMMRDEHRGYNGYLLERGGRKVCFGGDTAYTPAFAELNDPRHPIDLMIMPIGAYDPWIRAHCDPEQATEMARQAGARTFVPIHHQTFKLSSESMDEPARRLRAAWSSSPERLLAVDVGQTFRVPLI
ncbi:MAG TPA: MBL fold metallo-hydrolase [Opitutaceae bacterium]|nr:MBL fold metallo-hydrolase [Opitutaceae bacterium]